MRPKFVKKSYCKKNHQSAIFLHKTYLCSLHFMPFFIFTSQTNLLRRLKKTLLIMIRNRDHLQKILWIYFYKTQFSLVWIFFKGGLIWLGRSKLKNIFQGFATFTYSGWQKLSFTQYFPNKKATYFFKKSNFASILDRLNPSLFQFFLNFIIKRHKD